MPQGLIVKALSGFYYVLLSNKEVIECRARGQFKLTGITPYVGDHVMIELSQENQGTVVEILDRENVLVRPPLANVDQVLLVFSAKNPSPNVNLLDKFLVHTSQAGIETKLIFTKCDLLERDDKELFRAWEDLKTIYRKIGYEIFETAINDLQSFQTVHQLFDHKISVLAGQSGVGKSSLLNAICPHLQLQTGEISKKLGRGKHTTRHVELFEIGNQGFVADTPGFSQLDFFGMSAEQLSAHFIEISSHAEGCKFRTCAHIQEPSCAVREAVAAGQISQSRYDSYVQFFHEVKDTPRRY
jgi:ribosome biogenesis GTPase